MQLKITTLFWLFILSIPALAHDNGYHHIDHYLDNSDARKLGFEVKFSELEWVDEQGGVFEAVKMVVIHPSSIEDHPLQGSANLIECGALMKSENYVDSEDESKGNITTMVVLSSCAPLAMTISVYYSVGSEMHYYFIRALVDVDI